MKRPPKVLFAALVLAACAAKDSNDAGVSSSAPSASTPASAAPVTAAASERLVALREAEHRRAASSIEQADLSSRDPVIRRAASRALARVAGKFARTSLAHLLSDEDPEVVRWAAYGLGFDCADAREATVDALVARAIALPEDDAYDAAFAAIARAVGACAAPTKTEATLTAWLGAKPARASAAALALGDYAGRTKALIEDTWASLFAKAEGGVGSAPMPEALFAVSRVENVRPGVVERLAAVASARLADAGPFRLYAVRALGRVKAHGLGPLERVLLTEPGSFTMPERVEAALMAARLGGDGQVLLGKYLDKAAPKAATLVANTDEASVLLAVLSVLKDPKAAPKSLSVFAALPAPEGAAARARRIVSLVRCAAARVPPDVKPADPIVAACDLDKGWIGKTTFLEVLGRAPIQAVNLAALKPLFEDTDARVREAALNLLSNHPEIPDSASVVASALRAKEAGVVTVAAEQVQKAPTIASTKVPEPKPTKKKKDKGDDKRPAAGQPLGPPSKEVEGALIAAVDRAARENDMEMLGTLIEAIGALAQKSLLKTIEPHCGSSNPAVREHATNAIALLSSGRKPQCEGPARAEDIAPEVAAPATKNVTVRFETDAGELTIELDATLAPIAVARFTALVKRGYYDGTILHRVVPSYVVQFGSPSPDGYSGPADLPPIRCETSPEPFENLSVGVALAGRDTGSSQLFVMRGRYPHLDGQYAIVGRAKGPWETVMLGDTITKATVVE